MRCNSKNNIMTPGATFVTTSWLYQLAFCMLLTTASFLCGAADFKTPQFTDKKSRISTSYICAVIGHKKGFEPNAYQILTKFEAIAKISPKQSSAWREDAELWWIKERTKYDLKAFWDGSCSEQFDRINKVPETDSSHASALSIYETATEEQIRSATCALQTMSKESVKKLMTATQTYVKSKDKIAFIKAFQVDEVPTYLAKCFEVYEVAGIKEGTSTRDMVHFYDGSERALRLLILIEIAKLKNPLPEAIKPLKDQMYEELLKFNREYY